MFIKRNRSLQNGTEYVSTLLVEGVRVPVAKGPGRPSNNASKKTKVVHRTLANLSKLPGDLIAVIEAHCKGQHLLSADEVLSRVSVGPAYGAIAAAYAVARELGIPQILGTTRQGRLAMVLVLARLIHQGSRLSLVRWAEDQGLKELLEVKGFDEDDLYDTLAWIESRHDDIENQLAKRVLQSREKPLSVLYDVTSSYLEGQCHELGAQGYSRDGKRYKKQIVIGLLTADNGEPLAIQAYPGNTTDPKTFDDAVATLSKRFQLKGVLVVGDRGMIKSGGRATLATESYRYLTALTDPQVRSLLKARIIEIDGFSETPSAYKVGPSRRLICRRNPEMEKRDSERRTDQLRVVQEKVDRRNAKLEVSGRASEEVSLRQALGLLKKYKLSRFVTPHLEGRRVVLEIDAQRRAEASLLDGCCVLDTDIEDERMNAVEVWATYKRLSAVETDFRNLKTNALEIRPLYLRKANHTRGHLLVSLLALKIWRKLKERLAGLNLTVDDALDRLNGIRLQKVNLGSTQLTQIPPRHHHTQQELLDHLPPLPAPVLSLAP